MPTGSEVVRRMRRAFDKWGVPYTVAAGASSRGSGNMGTIQSVMTHHTAGSLRGNAPSRNVVKNGRPGLRNALCNLFLPRDGVWEIMAGRAAWHAGRVSATKYTNPYSLGVEAENTGLRNDQPWPKKQYDSYVLGVAALVDEFGLSVSDVVGHKEEARPKGRKIDPTFSMPSFRASVSKTLKNGGIPVAAEKGPDMRLIGDSHNSSDRVIQPGKTVRISVGKYFSLATLEKNQEWFAITAIQVKGLFSEETIQARYVLMDYKAGGNPDDIVKGYESPMDIRGNIGGGTIETQYVEGGLNPYGARSGGSIRLQLQITNPTDHPITIGYTTYNVWGS